MYSQRSRPLPRDALTVEAALGLPSLRRGAPRVVAGRAGTHPPDPVGALGRGPEHRALAEGRRAAADDRHGGRTFGGGATPVHARAGRSRRVAGVIVELGHVFSSLPAAFVEAANEGGLPLIELHREVMFVEVTEELHSNILNRQLAVLRRGDELHRRFTELLLDGAGIPEILVALARDDRQPRGFGKARRGPCCTTRITGPVTPRCCRPGS